VSDVDASTRTAVPVETVGRWIGPPARPLMAWFTAPVGHIGSVGVVIVPPLGYELWTSHRTLRTLAERLAEQGCTTVRFDFDGTGDSSGDQWDPHRLAAWRGDVATAAAALRGVGIDALVLVGLRMGGTLALTEGAAVAADAVVAWAPVVRGRRYVRELQLLGLPAPDDRDRPERTGAIIQAGSVFAASTLDDLGALDLATLDHPSAPRILIVDREDKPVSRALLDRLTELGVPPDHRVMAGTDSLLDRPTEYATVAEGIVDEIASWVGPGTLRLGVIPPVDAAAVPWQGVTVREEVVRLGAPGLVGILTLPDRDPRATVVWLNSGSEHHVGPGRAWVEYARDLALAGYASFRVDFSGWGESPDGDSVPGRPYDLHGVDEVGVVVAALRRLGHHRVVVAGLCAGAWIGLRAALDVEVDGVLAINPQLYWQPGDPVEADIITETRVRRLGEIARIKRLKGWGVWSALDRLGLRHPAATWLRALDRRGVPVMALFAEGDDGLEFLEDRTARTWDRARGHGRIEVAVIAEIDHPMHRHWHRPEVVSTTRAWLDRTVGGEGRP
jgi:alpha-beta hydrolase superfamily lysophospholipase